MLIKGKRLLDTEACHHDPTDTVSETPAFIIVALKDRPRLPDIIGPYPFYLRNLLSKQASSETTSTLEFTPHFHQSEQLVDHVIGRHQRLAICLKPGISRSVVGIVGHECCKPGPSIYKDHTSP